MGNNLPTAPTAKDINKLNTHRGQTINYNSLTDNKKSEEIRYQRRALCILPATERQERTYVTKATASTEAEEEKQARGLYERATNSLGARSLPPTPWTTYSNINGHNNNSHPNTNKQQCTYYQQQQGDISQQQQQQQHNHISTDQ